MMNKIIDILKKYKIAIISCLTVLTIGLLLIVIFTNSNKKVDLLKYKNDYVSFEYDSTWNLDNNDNNGVILKHSKDSEIKIQVVSLEEGYEYYESDEIIEEILFKLKKQNETYNLLSKEKDLITKYKYDGYKLLYENNDNQVLVFIGKNGDKVLLITYEATNEYFDILLDSVQNIVYNCHVLDTEFELNYKLSVETEKIEWPKNDKLKISKKSKTYEIADNNYILNYSLPDNFLIQSYDSTYSYFKYIDASENEKLKITVNVYNKNIYSELEKDSYSSLYILYNYQRESQDYSDFKEVLSKENGDSQFDYIYKNSYTYVSEYTGTKLYEDVVLIYIIDNNHIAEFVLNSENIKITKELINSIKVISTKNYSSYIKRKEVDGYLVGELYSYVFFGGGEHRKVTLKLPTKYVEIDKKLNIYSQRYYGVDYDINRNIYKYNVNYQISKTKIIIDSLNDYYKSHHWGEYKEITYVKDVEINGLIFKMYVGGYKEKVEKSVKDKSGDEFYYVNTVLLIHDFDEYNNFIIEINGNGVNVNDEVIKELTNFEIENIKN